MYGELENFDSNAHWYLQIVMIARERRRGPVISYPVRIIFVHFAVVSFGRRAETEIASHSIAYQRIESSLKD